MPPGKKNYGDRYSCREQFNMDRITNPKKQIIMKTIKKFIEDKELPHPFVAVLAAELITIVVLLLF